MIERSTRLFNKTDFTEQDTRDLFEILAQSGMRFGISEFQHPVVLALAEHYGLHVTDVATRKPLPRL